MTEREYDDDYPTCFDTYASLTFRHWEKPTDEVTRLLGVEPTEEWADGGGAVVDGVPRAARWAGWLLGSQGLVDSLDFRRHLDFVLDRVHGKEASVAQLLAGGWQSDISVYWASRTGHGGPMLWPEQASKIGALGIEVWFDIYFVDGEDTDEPLAPRELTSNFRRAQRHWRRFGIPRRRR